MNQAQHILSELELAQKRKLLECLSVRPERTGTVFYVIFTSRVGLSNRQRLEQVLQEEYSCRTERLSPDGLMIHSNQTLAVDQVKMAYVIL